jgi:hypothetical protein
MVLSSYFSDAYIYMHQPTNIKPTNVHQILVQIGNRRTLPILTGLENKLVLSTTSNQTRTLNVA